MLKGVRKIIFIISSDDMPTTRNFKNSANLNSNIKKHPMKIPMKDNQMASHIIAAPCGIRAGIAEIISKAVVRVRANPNILRGDKRVCILPCS
jgi:hypothetical protein